MKIGEVASTAGVTVRTLQYYDRIGLLTPTEFSTSGQRLYSTSDLALLYRIIALRALGFTLRAIADMHDSTTCEIRTAVTTQADRVKREITRRRRILNRLRKIERNLKTIRTLTSADIFSTIQAVHIGVEQYASQTLIERDTSQRSDISQLTEMWQRFIETLKRCKSRSAALPDPEALFCVQYWDSILKTTTTGDEKIEKELERIHANSDGHYLRFGLTNDLYQYLQDLRSKAIRSV